MTLDKRGAIAVGEIVFYVPVLLLSVVLVLRHGAARRTGWIFFAILAIARIIGGIAHVLSEHQPNNTTLRVMYAVFESVGLSPLLLATLGFLHTTAQYAGPLSTAPPFRRPLSLLPPLLATAGIALAVLSGTHTSSATTAHALHTASTYRRAAALLFAALYVLVALLTAYCWAHRAQLLPQRRALLFRAPTAAQPFLLVRVLYAILAAFAPPPFTFDDAGRVVPARGDGALGAFEAGATRAGAVWVYLAMSVLMECAVVLVCSAAGLSVRLERDLVDYQRAGTCVPVPVPVPVMHMPAQELDLDLGEEAAPKYARAQRYY